MFKRFDCIWALLFLTLCATCSKASELAFSSQFIERNQYKLFTRKICPDNAANKSSARRQLVMAHGLTYSSHEFDVNVDDYSLARYFAQQGYCVWLYDTTGYGQSTRPADGFMVTSDYAAEDLAAVVAHVRQQMKVDQVSLLGWSWGTVVAARFTIAKPEWVKNLVLYAPIYWRLGSKPPTEAWHQNSWAHAASDFQLDDQGQIDFTFVDAAVANQFLANCWRFDGDSSPNGGRRELLDGGAKYLFPLEKITIPVLLIGGGNDPLLNWPKLTAGFAKIAHRNANKLVKLEGGSHVLMIEKHHYREFRQQVLAFLIQTEQ